MRGTRSGNEAKRRLSQRHERAIAEKFDMSAFHAIPSAMRPPTAEALSYELLAKLSDLAVVVPDVDTFRKALEKGWMRRVSSSTTRSSLLLEDIGTALELLSEEDSEEDPLPYSPAGRSRVPGDDHVLEDVPKGRSSKIRAYQNIAGYVKDLKPKRKSSGLAGLSYGKLPENTKSVTGSVKVQPDTNEVEVDNYFSPKRMINKREVGTSVLHPDRSKRKSEPESLKLSPQPLRTRAKLSRRARGKLPVPLLTSSDPSISPASTAVRRSNRERNKKGIADNRHMSRQEEHALFFEMPEDQHYKTLDPRTLNNPLEVSSFEGIKYPIEVPNPDKKGEYWEMHSEEDLREHVGMLKARILSAPSTSVEHRKAAPTISQQAASRLGGMLDARIQKSLDSLLSVFAEAYRAQGSGVTRTKREQLDSLNDEFTRDIRAARANYENGLRDLGVLPELALKAEQEAEEARPQHDYNDGTDDWDKDYSVQVEEQIARESNRY